MKKVKRARTSSRTIGGNPKKFEKVVEWNNVILKGKQTFIFGWIMMIPIVNIVYAFALISIALEKKKVYWREIK